MAARQEFCTKVPFRVRSCSPESTPKCASTFLERRPAPTSLRRSPVAKILIVEDDEMLMDLMQQTLALSEHITRGAVNGADALAKVEGEAPDLILMDIGMPTMDGFEVTRRLKANPATRRIPVIALTAHASAADRQQAFAAGADEYEPKPVDFERLLGKITALLQRRAS